MTIFTEKTSQAELLAEITRLKAASANKFKCKVGTKGGVSVSGFGRYPVTLYLSQWEDLFGFVPQIKEFIELHRGKLAVKD